MAKLNYRIVDNFNGFNVVETNTDQTLFTTTNHAEAKKMMKHLNLGGCFDGFTPNFFLKSVKNSFQNTK